MDIPPWYWITSRRRRSSPFHSKARETRLDKYNSIDISSSSYQRKAWRRLQKSIFFYIAILNRHNISLIRTKLLKVNIVRGKGLLCHAIMNAQLKFTDFTDMYADLISLINYEFPNIGELFLTRCIVQFKREYDQGDKHLSSALIIFIAHLIKRNVASGILAIDLLKLLCTSLTEHSIHLICDILSICGNKVANEQNQKVIISTFFRMLQYIFFNKTDKKISDMVYKVLKQCQNKLKVKESVDLVDQNKQLTHLITLNSATDPQYDLNFYVRDIDYEANEQLHFHLVFKKILKYEGQYYYNAYDSDCDADNEEDSEKEETS